MKENKEKIIVASLFFDENENDSMMKIEETCFLLIPMFFPQKILVRFQCFLRKLVRTNPKKGPFHYRAPARMLWRVIRGMLPHKSTRGTNALGRLRCYEGVPPPYDKMKRVIIPEALRILRVKPTRKVTQLKRLAQSVGWKHSAVVDKLEVCSLRQQKIILFHE